ncbi:hypothetical protein D3C73_1463570 [compost metagenome]
MILAGAFFPIDIVSDQFYKIISWTPFPYLAFFPIKLLTNQIEESTVIQGLLTQGIWIVILFFAGRVLWKSGLKVYTEAGG